jgi:hypothetical protein
MQIRKIIQRRIRQRSEGVDLAGDVNAVVSANVGRGHSATHAASRQTAVSGKADEGGAAGERTDKA